MEQRWPDALATYQALLASDGVPYAASGTTTCETMRDGASVDTTHVCTEYDAGVPEQSRNVSREPAQVDEDHHAGSTLHTDRR